MRIALGLEYNGGAYRGWQVQTEGRTLQGTLEDALSRIAGHPVAAVAAGRTDTGVHALSQVVHFDAGVDRPPTAWVRGVNTHLPKDMAVQWAIEVPDEFHARFSASGRRYRYYLLNRAIRPGILAGRIGWDYHPLEVGAMQEAAARLVGRHDFSAFRAAECQARSPIRHLTSAGVRRTGEFVIFDFAADAFLHHMVRNLVGSLVDVGRGRHAPDWVDALLAERDRRRAAPTFMADGLYLAGIEYAMHWRLPNGRPTLFPWETD